MSSGLPTRVFLLSTAVASLLSLGASAPAMADVFVFGQTGASGQYASDGILEIATASDTKNISTEGNQGWVTDALNSGQTHTSGAAKGASTNYIAGFCGSAACPRAVNHNNYFVFSLAGIKGPVTAATLALQAGNVVGTGYYNIYDATPLADKLSKGVAGPSGLYSSLTTSGPLIGYVHFKSSDTGSTFDMTLNNFGLTDLNRDILNGVTNFVIGGAVTTPNPAPSPLPGVGLLQFFCLLGFLAFAAARARFRA